MRNYVRKTDRVKVPSDVIDRAVAKVLDEGKSVYSVAIVLTFQEEVLQDMLKTRRSQV